MNKQDLYKLSAVEIYKLVLEGKLIKTFPKYFWEKPDSLQWAKEITKYLIEEKLKLSDEELKRQWNQNLFKDNKLFGMLNIVFKGSPYDAINNVYPGKFKPWEFKSVPMGFWTLETAKEATKWLIEEKLQLSDDILKKQLSNKLFKDNGLSGMIQTVFNSSPYSVIDNAYPNKFKPWEFKSSISVGFWTLETAKEATKWLIEEKLKLSNDELKDQLSTQLFTDNGLDSMIRTIFNGSSYNAIDNAYPGKFKPWEFKNTPMNFWTLETAKEATKWLIEEKLKLSDDELRGQLSNKLFRYNGLNGMTQALFDGSPFKAIDNAYPGKFKPWEFKNTTMNFWTLETAKEATKWLIEEKLKLSDDELKEQLSNKLFIDNGLSGMIQALFDGSPFKAIDNAYPGKFKPWEFKSSISVGFWTLKTAKEATKWLIEEKLKLSDDELKEQLSIRLFVDNGLSGMIQTVFNSSSYNVIDNAYPGKFKPWEFKNYR